MSPHSFVPGKTWGPLSGPQIPPPSPTQTGSGKEAIAANSDPPSEKHEEKPSHDASVFVGSLPTNIDQVELTRLLTEHLSEYAEVKTIKVVRDSKGGICAFVQCESADAASNLIRNLHIEKPKPFMGRVLRFEPARAFRTLLISYRAPSYATSEPTAGRANSIQTLHTLELPTAMRIWKARGARFHNIAYNADAFAQGASVTGDEVNSDDALLLHPLSFDEDTIRAMASYFGRVETIKPFQADESQSEGPLGNSFTKGYPPPHDAPRPPVMDTGCWEVKWDFRDDCVSALMALRRVPHLTVTWAHQPSYSGWECRHPNYSQFTHASQPNYVLNHTFSSPSSFTSACSNFPSSVSDIFTGVPHEGGIAASHSEQSTNNSIAHSSRATEPLVNYGSGWNIWRPSMGADPSQGPAGSYPIPQTYTGDGTSDVPSTPKTPSTVYPLTPTSCTEDDKSLNYVPELQEGSAQRNIDPTSLFVGGLEIVGPSPWDEEKVRQHFARYGGLQHVKLVRPLNGVTGFAFLKFDNVDGPARAVLEEHNRVYGSHVLRVRLRDCNPPRNPWKHGRGRGRLFHHNGPGYRKFHFVDRFNYGSQPSRVENPTDEGTPTSTPQTDIARSLSPNQSTEGLALHEDSVSPPPSDSENSVGSSSPALEGQKTGEPERYREWYDELDAAAAQGHHTMSVSPSMTMFPPPYPYVFQNVPYYGQPSPWVQPYVHQQAPYPIPYFSPYPVYPPVLHGHPLPGAGEQGQFMHQPWSPPGVAYPPPYYAFHGAQRPSTENLAKTPPSSSPHFGSVSATQVEHSGSVPLQPPPGLSPTKIGPALEHPRHPAANPAPTQPHASHTPRVFIPPPMQQTWNTPPAGITSHTQPVQPHGLMHHPPPWLPPAPPHHVHENNHQQVHHRQQQLRAKRQNPRQTHGQAGFQGNRGANHHQTQYQRGLHRGQLVNHQVQPAFVGGSGPPGTGGPSAPPPAVSAHQNQQSAAHSQEKQPPVWI